MTLIGPRQVFSHLSPMQTAEDYLALQRRMVAKNKKALPFYMEEVHEAEATVCLQVYVNESRLLVDCHECGNGVVISDEWKLGCCFWCGAIYRESHLVFPEVQ